MAGPCGGRQKLQPMFQVVPTHGRHRQPPVRRRYRERRSPSWLVVCRTCSCGWAGRQGRAGDGKNCILRASASTLHGARRPCTALPPGPRQCPCAPATQEKERRSKAVVPTHGRHPTAMAAAAMPHLLLLFIFIHRGGQALARVGGARADHGSALPVNAFRAEPGMCPGRPGWARGGVERQDGARRGTQEQFLPSPTRPPRPMRLLLQNPADHEGLRRSQPIRTTPAAPVPAMRNPQRKTPRSSKDHGAFVSRVAGCLTSSCPAPWWPWPAADRRRGAWSSTTAAADPDHRSPPSTGPDRTA